MRIIFDSEEEREEFIDNYCPSAIGLSDSSKCGDNMACDLCWMRAVAMKAEDE